MKKFLSLALICAATIITSSANAGYKTKAEAIQAYNKVQAEYQKCVFNYNEARDSEYGSAMESLKRMPSYWSHRKSQTSTI